MDGYGCISNNVVHHCTSIHHASSLCNTELSYAVCDFFFPPFYICVQIAPVENDDSYDELKRDAKTCLSLMSQGLLYPEQIPLVLSVLNEVSLC